jgi:hypothetical protein
MMVDDNYTDEEREYMDKRKMTEAERKEFKEELERMAHRRFSRPSLVRRHRSQGLGTHPIGTPKTSYGCDPRHHRE